MDATVSRDIIERLRQQDCRWTLVCLRDGRRLRVLNIAWGLDEGELHHHITTNASPPSDGVEIDFFLTNEIIEIRDVETDRVLWQLGEL